jgi:endonuclease YncB( thermonuclease family)
VVSVQSGDHIVVLLPDGSQKTVGLWGTDAPEVGQQPFGDEARDYLTQRLQGKIVTLQSTSEGDDPSAKVYVDSKLINEEMVLQGYSWWVPFWAPDSDVFKEAQQTARNARLGLWSKANPTPPWVYREKHKLADPRQTGTNER